MGLSRLWSSSGKLISIFCFIFMILPSVSAYQVVHYDDFKYTANYTDLINNHGFFPDTGIEGCTASYGTEHYLLCYNAVTRKVTQKFNLVDENYCLMGNYTYASGARNFSIRGKVRTDEIWKPFTTSETWRGYVSAGNGTSDASFPLFAPNSSSSTRWLMYRIATSYTLLINPIDYTDYTFQVDYFMETNGALSDMKSSNLSVCNSTGSCASQWNVVPGSRSFSCLNTTIQLLRGGYYLDYISVIAYDDGERFIPITTPITDYWSFADNSMPTYDFRTTDKNGYETSVVGLTVNDCQPTYINGWIVESESDCNPLYLDFYNVFDADGDTVESAYSCGRPVGVPDFYALSDNFTDTLLELLARYDADGCNFSVGSLDAGTLGLRYDSGGNCTILTSHFDNEFPDDQVYLYPNFNVFAEISFSVVDDARQMFQFNNLASGTPIVLGFVRDSASGKFRIYSGSSCCMVAPTLDHELLGFTNSTPVTLRLMLNKDTSQLSYRLEQDGTFFYSAPVIFDWSSPISSMRVYADTVAVPFAPVNRNQVIGEYSIFSTDELPAFATFSLSEPYNCTSGASNTWDAVAYMTDTVHGDNYLNYYRFTWQASPSGIDQFADGTTIDGGFDLDMLFLGSTTLKYLFALGIITVLSVSMFIIGAMYGSVLAGAVIAMFVDTIAIFLLVLLGILPGWIAVVVFMVLALAVAFLLSKVIGGGGGGDGGG